MSEQHFITVVVRTKNRPDRLQEALDSIAVQTYPWIEVVVVNDGGDCVEALVNTWQHRTQRQVQYIAFPHSQGRSAALNRGFQSATGTWLAILDDDDLYHPSALNTLLQQALHRQLAVVYGIVELVDYTGTERILKKKYQTPYSRHRFLFENYIPVNAILFKKSLLDSVGLLDEQFYIFEDWDFLFRLSLLTDFGFVEEVVAEYRNFGTATGAAANDLRLHRNARQQFYAKHWSALNPLYLNDFYDFVYQDAESKYVEIVTRTDQHIQNNELHFRNFFITLQAVVNRLNDQDKRGNEFLTHFSNLFNIENSIAKRIDDLEKRNNEFERHFSNLFDNTHITIRDIHDIRQQLTHFPIMMNLLSEASDKYQIDNKATKESISNLNIKIQMIEKENIDFFQSVTQKIDHQNFLLTSIIGKIDNSLSNRIKNNIKRFFYKLFNIGA